MSLVMPKETGGDFELTPSGSHVAICYRVIDLGTQLTEWEGAKHFQRKVMLSWELPDELMADGQPFSIHKRYTLSSSPKAALRKDLEAWRGVPFSDADFGVFDLGLLLGKGCMLGVNHTTKDTRTYANISSIMRMPKGMQLPAQSNENLYFSLNDYKQEIYDKLSDSLKAIIALSPEYQKLMGNESESIDSTDAPLDDSIPF